MIRPLTALSILVASLSATFAQGTAHAQSMGFSLDRFDPAPAGSMWFVLDSLDLRGHGRPAFGVLADYSYRSLVLYNPDGSTRSVIVGDQLYVHAAASVVILDRLRLGLDLPVAVFQHGGTGTLNGVTYQGPNGAALGDIRLDADVRLFGVHGDPFTLAVGTQFYLPTGSRSAYTGDGGVRLAPHLLAAGQIGIFAYSTSIGLVYHGQDQAYATTPVGGELTLSGAVGLLLANKHLLIGPEINGRTDVTDGGAAFSKNSSPVEGLFGIHGMATSGWRFGLGAGTGFTQGIGSPAARVIASVSFAPSPKEEPPPDRDGDGIIDTKDACPDEAGVHTDDPATNGCPLPTPVPRPAPPPDLDRDKDGILNEADACPDVPGEPDPDPAKNGCPRAMVEHGSIKILDQVKFRTDSAEILAESDRVLNAVLGVLSDHLDITRVDVVGYTDDRGPAAHNQKLSEQRAASVVKWLASHGVEGSRLSSHGFGQNDPIDTNSSEVGRQNNRRVEFHITGGAVADTAGAAPARRADIRPTPLNAGPAAASETAITAAPPDAGVAKEGPPKKAHKTHEKGKSHVELEATGTALGVADSNIFDKGAGTVQAAGADVTLGLTLGVPATKRVSWISGAGVGTNYRDGIAGSVGDANALRVDANLRTGVEVLLLGKTSLAGRKVKKAVFPALKLSLEAKYALWANPFISQPPAQSDESEDALEPSDDDDASGASDGGGIDSASVERRHRPRRYAQADSQTANDGSPAGGDEASEEETDDQGGESEAAESPAEVPAGPQTFSNPNFHNKVSGIARATLETSKKLTFVADLTFGRDFVNLDDSVEVSPNYDEVTGELSTKYKLRAKLWLSAGYTFERRIYDDLAASGASQDFFVQGGKVGIDVPLKKVKLKLSYDARLKFADAGSSKNATRNQVQLGVEVPLNKIFSVVGETRFTYTLFGSAPDSARFIGLAGFKVKL